MSPIKRTYSAQEIKHNLDVYNLVRLQFLTKTLLKINEMKYNGVSAHFFKRRPTSLKIQSTIS
jgi:hypothetical protein